MNRQTLGSFAFYLAIGLSQSLSLPPAFAGNHPIRVVEDPSKGALALGSPVTLESDNPQPVDWAPPLLGTVSKKELRAPATSYFMELVHTSPRSFSVQIGVQVVTEKRHFEPDPFEFGAPNGPPREAITTRSYYVSGDQLGGRKTRLLQFRVPTQLLPSPFKTEFAATNDGEAALKCQLTSLLVRFAEGLEYPENEGTEYPALEAPREALPVGPVRSRSLTTAIRSTLRGALRKRGTSPELELNRKTALESVPEPETTEEQKLAASASRCSETLVAPIKAYLDGFLRQNPQGQRLCLFLKPYTGHSDSQ